MTDLAYLTADLPGIGGAIKQRHDDFFVEERPLYEPVGSGQHLYIYTEKRGLTTSDAIRKIAKAFRVGRGEVGYAGLKDKHAVTRQLLSINLPDSEDDDQLLSRINYTPVKVLWARRHVNKLRRGHLKGNRFVIRIRGVEASAAAQAQMVLDRLSRTGVPNYVGEQRFGYRANNHVLGRLMLQGEWRLMLKEMLGNPRDTDSRFTHMGREAYERGDYTEALEHWPKMLRHDRQALDALRQGKNHQQAVMMIDRQHRDLLVSAAQSAVFNAVLERRVRDDLLGKLIDGDLAWLHANRSVFAVDAETAGTENATGGRIESLEISPSGPMWGNNMTRAAGRVLEWEEQAFAAEGLSQDDLPGGLQGRADGARRPLRVVLQDHSVTSGEDEHGTYVEIAFALPRGSFATVVLREIMKPQAQIPVGLST